MRRVEVPNDAKVNKHSSRATAVEGTSGANEKASSNRTADSDHVEVARFQGLVELVVHIRLGTALEGLGGEAHLGPNAQLFLMDLRVAALWLRVDWRHLIAAAGLDAALLHSVGLVSLVSHGGVGLEVKEMYEGIEGRRKGVRKNAKGKGFFLSCTAAIRQAWPGRHGMTAIAGRKINTSVWGTLGGAAGRALDLGGLLGSAIGSRPSRRILGCQCTVNSAKNGMGGGRSIDKRSTAETAAGRGLAGSGRMDER